MGQTVLVVDNDRVVVEFMCDLLTTEGFEVITANDGLSALDVLEQHTPDIIFTDLVMPKIDGRQLCRIIRQIPRLDDVFLIVMSGLMPEDEIDRDTLGADAIITKGPFVQIADSVVDILKQPQARRPQTLTGGRPARPRGITGELFSAKRHLEIILERMSEGVLEITGDGRIIYANPAAISLVEMPEKRVLGSRILDFFSDEDRLRIEAVLDPAGDGKQAVGYETPLLLMNRQVIVRMLTTGESTESGVVIISDITELKKAEAAVRQRNIELKMLHRAGQAFNSTLDFDRVLSTVLEEVRGIMNATGSTIWLRDNSGGGVICRHATGPHSRLLHGWRLDDGEGVAGWVARSGEHIIVTDTRTDRRHFKEVDRTCGIEIRSMVAVPLRTREEIIGTLQVVDERVGRFSEWHLTLLQPLAASAAIAIENARLYRKAQREIEERRRAEERIIYNAFHDRLTGLPNRALFLDRLEEAIKRAKRRDDYSFGVILMGLDRFKAAKDSLGHSIGEQILVQVARDLKAFMRSADTVARLGGDEFCVLVHDVKNVRNAMQIARRIHEGVVRRLRLGEQDISLTASAGLSIWHSKYTHPQDMLRDAETAMYNAKKRGKGISMVFDRTMHADAVARLEMERALGAALKNGELMVYYQPYVSLESGRICGMEALARWVHPRQGIVSPEVFIPVAEQTGLIQDLGLWVLREACRQMHKWLCRYKGHAPLTISVNLSGRQLSQKSLVDSVASVLKETRLDPGALKLEITESVLMEDASRAVEYLMALKQLDIQLVIDDFGTGYSSLSYLHRFPVDALKVDRSFVGRMHEESRNLEIVRTIVTLARTLNMDVFAEGIETRAQLAKLRSLNCRYGQGFLFSKPRPHTEMEKMLAARPRW